ncbi:MAG: translation initiation factor, partial [Planctomycetota bacterium]
FDGTALQRPVTCAKCEKTMDACDCPRDAAGDVKMPADQPARVLREKRRGKWTTVVTGLDPVATDLPALLKQFKTKFATGGTTRNDGIELQGDVRDKVIEALSSKGYPTKPAGG